MLVNVDLESNEVFEKYASNYRPEFRNLMRYEKDETGAIGFGFFDEDHIVWTNVFKNVSQGVYQTNGFDSSNFMKDTFDAESYLSASDFGVSVDNIEEFCEFYNTHSQYYGVADNWEQVLEIKTEFAKSEHKFVMTYKTIYRENETRGGWRWHKWGEYIGNQNPQHEYLYDEIDIDSIIIYHFHRLP